MIMVAVGILALVGVVIYMRQEKPASGSKESYAKQLRRTYPVPVTSRVSSSRPIGIRDARGYDNAYTKNNYILA